MAIAFVASVNGTGLGVSGGALSAFNSTGANLIVVHVAYASTSAGALTVTDNKGNTYTALTESAASVYQRQYYCLNPVVGTGHIITIGSPASTYYPCVTVNAFSGVGAYHSQNTGTSAPFGPCDCGSVTPTVNGSLLVAGLGGDNPGATDIVPSGFTGLQTVVNVFQGSSSYLIQTTAATINPQWSWTGGTHWAAASVSVFSPLSLPTTGLTGHWDASSNDDLWKTFVSGGPHTGVPADGDTVVVMDSEESVNRIWSKYSASAAPVWRSTTPLMPQPCLDFVSGQRLLLTNNVGTALPLSNLATLTAYTVFISFYAEGITFSAGTRYAGHALIGDDFGCFGAFLHNTSGVPKVSAYNFDGSEDYVTLDCSVGVSHVLMFRHQSGVLYASLDGGSESSVSSGNMDSVDGSVWMGGGTYGGGVLNGRIGEVAIYNVALTGTDLTNAKAYFNAKWLVAGSPSSSVSASASGSVSPSASLSPSSSVSLSVSPSASVSPSLSPSSSVSSSASPSVPPPDPVVLLIGAEVAVVDESTYARTLTLVGNAARSTAQAKYGSASIALDGVGDWVEAADSTDFTIGTNDFTIEGWFRFNIATNQGLLGHWHATSVVNSSSWLFYISSTNLTFRYVKVDGSGFIATTYNWSSLALSTWYHLAVDKSGTALRMYIDGVVVGTNTITQGMRDSASKVVVGVVGDGAGFPGFDFSGYVDEVRITNGLARYAGAFTPPSGPFPRVSPSSSVSLSVSPSVSPSISPSVSLSLSPSASESPSASASPTPSPSLSPSASVSESASESPTPSQSLSPSASVSQSASESGSISPSQSTSPSASVSASVSRSPSQTGSPSLSPSASVSPSPSPAAGAPKQPNFWVRMRLEKNPVSAGTLLYDWSFVPKSHIGSWKEDRLISISQIERALSQPDGTYEISRISVTVDDSDGIIRDLLNNEETAYWDGREVEVCLLSDEGLEAGMDPFIVFRGRIDGIPSLQDERAVTFEVVDFVGSKFSAFDLEQDLVIPIGDEHENLPEGLEANYNIVYGEHSDLGSKDQNGAAVDKGLIPGVFVGMYDIGGGSPSPVLPPSTPRPTNLKATMVGGGSKTYYYAASVITPHGESMISDVLKVSGCPDDSELGLDNYVKLSCDFEAGPGNVNKIRWWGRYTNPPVGWLDESFYDMDGGDTQQDKAYYNDGSHPAPNPSRADVDRIKKKALPKNGAAAIPAVDTIWGMIVVAIGEVSIQGTPYASNLAEETQALRVAMPASLEGSEFVLPTSPQWPFPNPWLEKTNSEGTTIRFTAVLMRGARLQHHIDGNATIAFRVCGYKGENGQLIDQAFLQFQHFLNEFVVKDNGLGYRSGAFGPLEEFTNGDAMLWTRRFQEAQDISKALMGDTVGFQGAWCINESLTLRDFLQRFCVSFGCLFGINRHGQAFPVLPYSTASLNIGRLYRYPYDLEEVPMSEPQNGNRYNRIWYNFDWDSDLHEYRNLENMVENLTSQDAHGTKGKKTIYEPSETFELFCTRYPQTAAVAMGNYVLCYRKSPVYSTLSPLDLTALHDELGDRIRYEHWNSPRPGTTTQLLVLRHTLDINPGTESVVIIGWDMTRIAP